MLFLVIPPTFRAKYALLNSPLGILVADAGCILESLTEYVSKYNHIMPIDLGAKGRYIYHHHT